MIDVIDATFEDGVFKPDQPLSLADSTRVRLVVETVGVQSDDAQRKQAWNSLQRLWQDSTFDSQGDRLSRDQLHERR